MSVGTVLTETRDACVNDARIDGLHFLVIDTQTEFDVRSIIFDDHVGVVDQFEENFPTLIGFEVQGETAFVSVKVLEIGAMTSAS